MKKLIMAITLVVILVVGAIGSTVMAAPPDNKPIDAWDMVIDDVNEILAKIGDLSSEGWDTIAEALGAIDTTVSNNALALDDVSEDLYNNALALEDIDTTVSNNALALDDVSEDLYNNALALEDIDTTVSNNALALAGVQESVDGLETAVGNIQTDIDDIQLETDQLPKMMVDYGLEFINAPYGSEILPLFDSGQFPNGAHFVGQISMSTCGSSDRVLIDEYVTISSVKTTTLNSPTQEYKIDFVGSNLGIRYISEDDGTQLSFTWGAMTTYTTP
ncbi:hypothetical protein ACFLVN_01670 [Chloroflexota bacterium]